MSGKPLVPSKDALRALRHLAYSPPAALIGTTGTLCGVATIHYHERRKVRRAEEILRTKRKLHSISQGKGSARLALMFEAAERGEDFTLHNGRPPKSMRRHYHAASTAQEESDSHTDWKPFSSNDEELQGYQPDNVNSRETTVTHNANESAMAVKDIYKTSVTWGKWQSNDRYTWPNLVKQFGSGRRRSADGVREIMESPDPLLLHAQTKSLPVQPITDLHPFPDILEDRPATLSDSTIYTPFDNRVSLKHDQLKLLSASGFELLQPWKSSSVDSTDEMNEQDQSTKSSPDSISIDLYLDLSAPVPDIKVEHQCQSRYRLKDTTVRKGMLLIGIDRYMYVFNSLMNFRQKHGNGSSVAQLERTMTQYTATNKRPDFALVQALFLDCTRIFSTEELKPLIWRFVEKFLRGDAPRLEVVSFLYPRCGAGNASEQQQHYYFLVHQYLELMQRKGHSLDRQVIELRKILAGTRLSNIEFHEHLMVPILRAFCSAGRMTSAQALFNEMTIAHKVPASFYSLQILIKGYAHVGNWSKVKSMLDEYHSVQLSQHKVYGFSNLLVSIINDYSLARPPEQVVRFVMHSIELYGVQPVSSMTREIVSLCLRHRRYDLIVAWIDMVRRDFPNIEIGTGSSTFAFDVASVWSDIDASCEDILAGCRALATHALRDPFSKVFRSSISEAASQYMLPRLQTLREELGTDVPDFAAGGIHQFHTALKNLKYNAATQLQGSRARLQLMDLLNQAEALRWLNALCRGHLESQGATSRSLQLGSFTQAKHVTQDKLPPLDDLAGVLMKQYAQRDKSGQEIEHRNLTRIVEQLVQQDRPSDAFNLIHSVYDSQWAQSPRGREFELDLFTHWLKLAWTLKSGSRLRKVLWALLDASPQLKLNSHIILLARIAAPKTHLQNAKRARTYEVDEVEYLRLRLRRRHWLTAGSRQGLRFDDWHDFDKPSPIRRVETM